MALQVLRAWDRASSLRHCSARTALREWDSCLALSSSSLFEKVTTAD